MHVEVEIFMCSYSEQLTVLRENGRLKSPYSNDAPMVMLNDVTVVLLQLKSLVSKHDAQIQQQFLAAKRPRLS